jgi:hypothetical protein
MRRDKIGLGEAIFEGGKREMKVFILPRSFRHEEVG